MDEMIHAVAHSVNEAKKHTIGIEAIDVFFHD